LEALPLWQRSQAPSNDQIAVAHALAFWHLFSHFLGSGTMSTASLISTLRDFSVKVNDNDKLQKLLRGWSPIINVQAMDDGEACALVVRDQRIAEVLSGAQESSHEITVQGESALLRQIFSGSTNPAQAVLDGGLVVYGSDTDAIKLDAITLVLWGM
jgi:hypothetical protein